MKRNKCEYEEDEEAYLPRRKNNDFIIVNEFSEDACIDFREDFFRLEASPKHDIIPIYIDSFGGDVYSLQCMLSIIESSDKKVATICNSKAFSCGAILLSSGSKGLRFMAPNAFLLIHQVSFETYGKFSEVSVSTEHCAKLNSDLMHILDKNSGHPTGYFEKTLVKHNNSDWYLDCNQALKEGLIDQIGVPRLRPIKDDKLGLFYFKKSAKTANKKR